VLDAPISSSDEVVSSTLAACSPVPCDRVCAVWDTCAEAPASASAPARTSPIVWASFSVIVLIAARSFPSSSVLRDSTACRRSPRAIRSAASRAVPTGPVTERVIATLTATPTATASARMRSITFRAEPAAAVMTSLCACIFAWCSSATASRESLRLRAASFTGASAAFPSCAVAMEPARIPSSTRRSPAA
jgi:hypothetical protein